MRRRFPIRWTGVAAIALAALAQAATDKLPEGLDWSGSSTFHDALERISTRSGLSLPHQGWPLSTTQIREFLTKASERGGLTRFDSLMLTEFLDSPCELKRWKRADDGTFLAIEPQVQGSVRRDSSLTRRLGSLGGQLYGTLGGEIQWYSQATINTEWADDYIYYDRYPNADGEPSEVPFGDDNQNGLYKKRTFARYTAYVQWQHKWLTMKYGRDHIQHGPGEWTGLSTSRFLPPWTMFDTRIDPFDWLTVQATVLEARSTDYYTGAGDPRYYAGDTRKWLHVHRFEVRPFDGVALAFQNMVTYPADSSGGLQPAYLLPLVPIFFTQDLSGNRDNAAMQFDARIDRIPYLSLWGVFFIDDLDGPTTMFNNHWLNRWAALGGFRLLSPWKAIDADLTAEVSVVRPWTYTGGREAAYTFSHYGFATGSEGGPDSRSTHVRIQWRPKASLELGPEFSLQEKGIGRQAQLGVVHGEQDSYDVSLLEHAFRTWTMGGAASWEPWFGKRLTGSVGYAWSDSSTYRGMRWSASATVGW